jgi:hypothetical protein
MLNKLQKYGTSVLGVASVAFTAAQAFANNDVKPFTTAINPGTGWATDFGALINSVLSIVMVIALLLVLLYLVLGGIEWITSGGDKGKTESARNKITAAIIGIIILAAAYALTQLVAWLLGFGGLGDAFTKVQRINVAK